MHNCIRSAVEVQLNTASTNNNSRKRASNGMHYDQQHQQLTENKKKKKKMFGNLNERLRRSLNESKSTDKSMKEFNKIDWYLTSPRV